MLGTNFEKIRFEAKTVRGMQALALIFSLIAFLRSAPAQEHGASPNRQASVSALEQRVAQYPDSLALRYQSARDYMRSGQFAQAEKQLRAMIVSNPIDYAAYNDLGNALLLQNKLDSAAANYFQALALAKTADESLGVHFNLAALLLAANADSLAEKVWAEASRDGSPIKPAEKRLGINFLPHELFFSDATPIAAENVEPQMFLTADGKNKRGNNGKSGSNSRAGQNKGSQKAKTKKKDKTASGGQRAQAESPAESNARQEGTYKGAIVLEPAETRKAASSGSIPTQPGVVMDVANRLAHNYAVQGEYAKAEKYWREVIALDAGNFTAHNNLGNVHFLRGQLDSAMTHYSKALPLARTADDSLGIRLNLAALYHAVDAGELAAASIAEALRGRHDLPRVERLLGLKLDEIELDKARAEQLRGVTVFSMKQLVTTAGNFPSTRRRLEAAGKSFVVQAGARFTGEIENVFYWDH